MPLPEGCGFLPPGDAFVTRQVKAAGPHWVLCKRRKGYTAVLGVLAPKEAIARAETVAAETSTERTAERKRARKARERREQVYREEFHRAAVRFLDFVPEHQALAEEIPRGAAGMATQVGSGRVGRTRLLGLEERVERAVRAFIRHHRTSYEEELAAVAERYGLSPSASGELPEEVYREIRRDAAHEVDAFLAEHRTGGRSKGGRNPRRHVRDQP